MPKSIKNKGYAGADNTIPFFVHGDADMDEIAKAMIANPKTKDVCTWWIKNCDWWVSSLLKCL
ncbi:MAG TPA: hypothetical protein EYP23_05915 [Thermoplasmata archaeon]|nr:hypothetical protein [Thermoplasmata archaeon]